MKMLSISVVINTLNEEKNLPRAISSIKKLAKEIIVVDMHSSDATRTIAKEAGAKVFLHDKTDYVEPARNFAISKASGEWILVLDADEQASLSLRKKIREIIKNPTADYYRIPRKNMIFGKWVSHSGWWPDYNIRLFKKGFVSWNEIIHTVPTTQGKGADLTDDHGLALIHNNYETIDQFIARLNRYTSIQAKQKKESGYTFDWHDTIKRPSLEFLRRYFAEEGYKDGLHGLALAQLQAFSELVLYLKIWQLEKFVEKNTNPKEVVETLKLSQKDHNYWHADTLIKHGGGITQKVKRKLKLP